MSEPENKQPERPQEPSPVIYASPLKRVWAWVGVAYMLIILLLFTYFLAKAKFLNGIAPLMLAPALGGLAASAVVRYRTGQGKGGIAACVVLTGAASILFALNLIAGFLAVLANFGG